MSQLVSLPCPSRDALLSSRAVFALWPRLAGDAGLGTAGRLGPHSVLDRHGLPVRRSPQLAGVPLLPRPAAGPLGPAARLLPAVVRRHPHADIVFAALSFAGDSSVIEPEGGSDLLPAVEHGPGTLDRLPGPLAEPAEPKARMGLLAGGDVPDRPGLAVSAGLVAAARLPAPADGLLVARPRAAPQQAGMAAGLPFLPGPAAAVPGWAVVEAVQFAAPGADSTVDDAITRHAGSDILQGVSSHLLVATHTFLEMLHYGVWVVVIPLIGLRSAPWQTRTRSRWPGVPPPARGIATFLACGLGVVLVLWLGFLADYPTTRSVYFTVALAHVLAEVPFLLRAL